MERCVQVKIHLLISQESSVQENAVVTHNVQNMVADILIILGKVRASKNGDIFDRFPLSFDLGQGYLSIFYATGNMLSCVPVPLWCLHCQKCISIIAI